MSLLILNNYQKHVNQILELLFLKSIPNPFIQEMCYYSLEGGKRLRSSLCLDIWLRQCQILKLYPKIDVQAIDVAKLPLDICHMVICVELLHNTSLILDDLPSMDNDSIRRGKPTVHKKYNKSNAQMLASFMLMNGFKYWEKSLSWWQDKIPEDDNQTLFKLIKNNIDKLKRTLGQELMIATEGQAIDMKPEIAPSSDSQYWQHYDLSDDVDLNTIVMKTAPFYCVAFCGGFLLAKIHYIVSQINDKGMNSEQIEVSLERIYYQYNHIRIMSYQFSGGFQISDDILDAEKDKGKEKHSLLVANYVLLTSKDRAIKKMTQLLNTWRKIANRTNLWTPLQEELYYYLPKRQK